MTRSAAGIDGTGLRPVRPSGVQARVNTLESVLVASPLLGVRRATRLALQLAIELDLAVRGEVTPAQLRPDAILVENPGTASERARLPIAADQSGTPARRAGLAQLGRLIQGWLSAKPLYLEESIWMPQGAARMLRRRADAQVLHALGRALSLIAQRCIGAPRPYLNTIEPVRDLTRLAELTSRIVARRRSLPPVARVHRPRAVERCAAALPKVVVHPSALSAA
jgi:hypothetical protein